MKAWQQASDTQRRDLSLALLTLLLVAGVTFKFPGFAAPRNLANVFDDTAILIMLALGQMLVILVRGVDLSVAANLALCGMMAALFAGNASTFASAFGMSPEPTPINGGWNVNVASTPTEVVCAVIVICINWPVLV